jgi:hypothetical protein
VSYVANVNEFRAQLFPAQDTGGNINMMIIYSLSLSLKQVCLQNKKKKLESQKNS